MKVKNKTIPDNSLEIELLNNGYEAIIGIDEVGRGCWAGPVYLGGYIYRLDTKLVDNVNDSKLIPPKKRDEIFIQLNNNADFNIEIGDLDLINKYGIGKTLDILIQRMLEKFNKINAYFLIDGQFARNYGKNTRQIIKGDMKHYSISAASIIAKVSRDKLMTELSMQYNDWCFEKNKGYGTKDHIDAIAKNGICDLHRLNYKPIMQYINERESQERKHISKG
jgi:ribonuclease HII